MPEAKLQQLPKRHQFLRAIEEGYYKDVLIFAAAHNEHPLTRSYPAAFAPPLISVDKGLFDDPLQFAYQLRDTVEFQAHGRGYLGPFAREPATSWATPAPGRHRGPLLSLRPELKPFEIKTLLYWMFVAQHRKCRTRVRCLLRHRRISGCRMAKRGVRNVECASADAASRRH